MNLVIVQNRQAVTSSFCKEFKNHFQIPRYGDLPKSQFVEAIKFISMWQPSTTLRLEITTCNGQQNLKLIEEGA